jgi:4-amino-4-deoxy-L-arabinose transferase-like glycosyltransferase
MMTFSTLRHHSGWLWIILLLALLLRMGYALGQDHLLPYRIDTGDTGWYLAYGYGLAADLHQQAVAIPGMPGATMPVTLANLPTPPLYLLFVGTVRVMLPEAESAVLVIRVLQVLMGVVTCWLVYRLSWQIVRQEWAALLSTLVVAIAPAMVIEPATIQTETLYILLLLAGLCLYSMALHSDADRVALYVGGAALLLGLATLTRAVLLLFPVGLAVHWLLVKGWRSGLPRVLLLLLVYALVVGSWTLYVRVRYERWVIGAPSFSAFLFVGATEWAGPEGTDALLSEAAGENLTEPDEQNQAYQEAALNSITGNPLGWLGRRVSELTGAILQPHGTVAFPGPSLRDLAVEWWRGERSVAGLQAVVATEGFWTKLVIYGFHYGGILLGLIGLWRSRRWWRGTLPLLGLIVYTLLIHLLLLALPRYLFPLQPIFWVLAGYAFIRLDGVRSTGGDALK